MYVYVSVVLTALLVAFLSYTVTSLLGYFVHWAIHQRWSGRIHKAHMAHHLELYPPGKLVSEEYRHAGSQSTVHTFLVAFLPLLLLPVILMLVGVISLVNCAFAVCAMVIVGLLNDVIHDSFHVKHHWLSKVIPGYDRMRQLHFVHHINMRRNFGIYSFTWDKVFKTFR